MFGECWRLFFGRGRGCGFMCACPKPFKTKAPRPFFAKLCLTYFQKHICLVSWFEDFPTWWRPPLKNAMKNEDRSRTFYQSPSVSKKKNPMIFETLCCTFCDEDGLQVMHTNKSFAFRHVFLKDSCEICRIKWGRGYNFVWVFVMHFGGIFSRVFYRSKHPSSGIASGVSFRFARAIPQRFFFDEDPIFR